MRARVCVCAYLSIGIFLCLCPCLHLFIVVCLFVFVCMCVLYCCVGAPFRKPVALTSSLTLHNSPHLSFLRDTFLALALSFSLHLSSLALSSLLNLSSDWLSPIFPFLLIHLCFFFPFLSLWFLARYWLSPLTVPFPLLLPPCPLLLPFSSPSRHSSFTLESLSGEFSVEEAEVFSVSNGDDMLVLKNEEESQQHYAAIALLETPFAVKDGALVIQYVEAKRQRFSEGWKRNDVIIYI